MPQMLEGIKVIDFSQNLAGPLAGAMLADHGADVIKIEKMKGADERRMVPMMGPNFSLSAAWQNRGKKSVTLNIRDPEGADLARRLCADADVVIESNRPGVMKKAELDYETIRESNPSVIYCSVSMFGQKGPYAERGGYDILAQAMSGFMSVNGEKGGPPLKHGLAIGDYAGGMTAFSSIMTALFYRFRTGKGQYIDVSLLRSLLYLNGVLDGINVGMHVIREGNEHATLSPFGVYAGKGEQNLVIAAVSQNLWEKLCHVMGQPELITDPELLTLDRRVDQRARIRVILEKWLQTFEDIREAEKRLLDADIPCCRVYDCQDIWEDPHIQAAGFLVDVPLPNGYPQKMFRTRNVAASFSEAPPTIKQGAALGEHTKEILTGIGLTEEKIEELLRRWKTNA